MTPRKAPYPDESHLSREDIEMLAQMRSDIRMLVESVGEWRNEAKESRKAMKQDHDSQMRVLTTDVTDLKTWRASQLPPDTIARWEASAEWTERYQDRIGLLLSIAGLIFAVLSAIIGWVFNSLVLPWLQGGK